MLVKVSCIFQLAKNDGKEEEKQKDIDVKEEAARQETLEDKKPAQKTKAGFFRQKSKSHGSEVGRAYIKSAVAVKIKSF